MNIALVSSQGGHSGQMGIIFTPAVLGNHKTIFVTETPNADRKTKEHYFQQKYRTYFFEKDVLRVNPITYATTLWRLLSIFKKERTDVLITNGAQLSIPAVVAARLLGIHVIFLDTFIRVKTPNWSARFCYFFSHEFLVQHKNMAAKYGRRARFEGSVL